MKNQKIKNEKLKEIKKEERNKKREMNFWKKIL